VDVARPPRRVAGISVFQRRRDGMFLLILHWSRVSTTFVCGLREIVPWWRSYGLLLSLQLVASFGVAHRCCRRRCSTAFFQLLSQVVVV
jgi:hypothetical protein